MKTNKEKIKAVTKITAFIQLSLLRCNYATVNCVFGITGKRYYNGKVVSDFSTKTPVFQEISWAQAKRVGE